MTRAAWTEVERELNRGPRAIEGRQMGWGKWSRWGRGSCEGYGLDIGHLLRFSIVANTDRTLWRVSLNAQEIASCASFDEAIAAAESEARRQMSLAIEHWTTFGAQPKAKRRSGRNRR